MVHVFLFSAGNMIKVGEYHRRRNRLSFKHGSPIIWLGKTKHWFVVQGRVNKVHQVKINKVKLALINLRHHSVIRSCSVCISYIKWLMYGTKQ